MTPAILGIGILIGFFLKATINEYQKMRINNRAYGFGYAAGYKVGLEQNGIVIKQFNKSVDKLRAYVCCEAMVSRKSSV